MTELHQQLGDIHPLSDIGAIVAEAWITSGRIAIMLEVVLQVPIAAQDPASSVIKKVTSSEIVSSHQKTKVYETGLKPNP